MRAFKERTAFTRRAYRPLFESVGPREGDDLERELRRRHRERVGRKGERAPKGRTAVPGASLGSFTQVFTPPYDFGWTPQTTSGSPSTQPTADSQTGVVHIGYATDFDNASSLDCWAGVGIYWAIPDALQDKNSTCLITATADLSLSFAWQDECLTASASQFGEVVLNLDEFSGGSAGGQFEGLAISQPSNQWSDSSWWSGGSGSGSTNALSVTGSAWVDAAHFYNLWAFIHVNAVADGFHDAIFWSWYSDGTGSFDATVNSFTVTIN